MQKGIICSSLGCGNYQYAGTSKISFFTFPKDAERCKLWIESCGRIDLVAFLDQSPDYLCRNHRLCADHFDESQFVNRVLKNRLIHGAVPTIFDFEKETKCKGKKREMLEQMKSKAALVKKEIINGSKCHQLQAAKDRQSQIAQRKKSGYLPKSGVTCAAMGCFSYPGMGVEFFNFPSDRERCLKWIGKCCSSHLSRQFEIAPASLSMCFLCDKHFDDSQFANKESRTNLLPNAVPTLFNYTNPYNTVTQGCMGPRRTVVQADRKMFDSKGKTVVDHSYATNAVVDRNQGKPDDESLATDVCRDENAGLTVDEESARTIEMEPMVRTIEMEPMVRTIEMEPMQFIKSEWTSKKKLNRSSREGTVDPVKLANAATKMQLQYWSDIASSFQTYRDCGFLCDTLIKSKSREFQVHSVLLAAVSPVFMELFQENPNQGLRYMNLPDIDDTVMDVFLRFVYSGKLILPAECARIDQLSSMLTLLKDLGFDVTKFNGCSMQFESKQAQSEDAELHLDCTNEFQDPADQNTAMEKNFNMLVRSRDLSGAENGESLGFESQPVGNNVLLEVPDEFVTVDDSRQMVLKTEAEQMEGNEDDKECSDNHEVLAQGSDVVKRNTRFISTYICSICGKNICGTPSVFRQHMKKHTSGRTHICDKCGMQFRLQSSLIGHMKKHSLGREVRRRKRRMRSEREEQTWSCHFCCDVFQEKSFLVEHLKVHHVERPYFCHVCDKRFQTSGVLQNHLLNHEVNGEDTSVYKYSCTVCDRKMKFRKSLSTHMLIHNEKRHVCNMCGMKFVHRTSMQRHMLIHNGERPFLCQICGKAFRQRANLDSHSLKVHKRQCVICGMSLHGCSREEYRQHIDSHEGLSVDGVLNKYTCDVCHMSFATLWRFKNHVASHSSVKPFQCLCCGKAFALKTFLDQHMRRVHDLGEKPYQCQKCGKRFHLRCHLRTHETLHSGLKPYVCSTCGKAFRLAQLRAKHMNVHTGEKSYECELCKKRFGERPHLSRHMLTHTGEKPFACHQCTATYKVKHDLRLHYKRVHNFDLPKLRGFNGSNDYTLHLMHENVLEMKNEMLFE